MVNTKRADTENRREYKQRQWQILLAFVVIMPVFIDIAYVVCNVIGLGNYTSVVTAGFYLVVLITMILKCSFTVHDLCLLAMIYAIFVLNYFLFQSTRSYLVSQSMILVYVFFLPYGVIGFRHIRKWDMFLKRLYQFSEVAIICSLIMLVVLPYEKHLVYMDFSYALLPAICTVYNEIAGNKNTKGIGKMRPFLFFAISILEIVLFGARAPLLFVVVYIVVYEMRRTDTRLVKKLTIMLLFVVGALFISASLDYILLKMANSELFSNSYLVRSYLHGQLFESNTRYDIWEQCLNRISTMGMYVGGFFGDRSYCISVYPHNFFLEIIMSWGWFIGMGVIILFLTIIVKGLNNKNISRDIVFLMVCCIFSRYLVSGTYLTEGKFWIALFACIAASKCKSMVIS